MSARSRKASSKQATLPGFEMETPSSDAESPAEPVSPPAQQPAPPLEMKATEPPESLRGKTVWVIDSHSLIYQVFHAVREMTGPAGQPVAAVYGFTRDILYLWEQKKPDYLFCAFDMPGKTFRHEMYDQYKINRKAMPEDLVPQIASIRRMIESFNIPALGVESFEADDILATMAATVERLGGDCVLVTSDKDCRQLITDRVTMYNIRKDEVFDRDALAEVWGISPQQVVDFRALVGDSSDNVPGVPLIGAKFAQQLLEKYGTLDEVLDKAEEVSGKKRKENLLNYRDQAELSRKLVRLDANVPVPVDWEKGRLGGGNRRAAEELFDELGFRSLKGKLKLIESETEGETTAPPPPKKTEKPKYKTVDTTEALEEFVAELRQQKLISLDTETTDIRPRWAELVGLSFAWKDDEAWYLPVRAPKGDKCLDLQETLETLRPVLEDPQVAKIGQNLKYDTIVLRAAGVELAGVAFDTMVASYLLDAGLRSHNLDDLASRYLDHTTTKISELIGTGRNQKCMDEVPVALVCDYAGEDALLPLRLRPLLAEKLEATDCRDLFDKLELPLIDVLVEMEYNGIKVDVERLGELSTRYGERIEELRGEIHELAGREFNVASPKQLQEILFEELELPVIKQTAKTGPSTDAEVLEELAAMHPLPAKLLEFRKFAKLKSTYVDALPEMVNPETGRVHASFNQVVTATGRLSSSDPNLQNIPVRGEGREIRSAFVPDPADWTLLAADYSQIELRVLAHYSGDKRLCEAFVNDEDIHARVASQVGGVPLDEVTPEMRWRAKAVNFGVIYGQGAFGLAKSLGIEKSEAAEFIDGYFEGYPDIEQFLVETLAKCRRNGYVSTLEGRRRAIQGVRESAGRQRNLAERTAVNTMIQGSAADLIKIAMVAIHRRLRQEDLEARMLLQIHDELIFEVPREQLTRLRELVIEEMVGAARLNVPLKVDVKTGPSWADAEPV